MLLFLLLLLLPGQAVMLRLPLHVERAPLPLLLTRDESSGRQPARSQLRDEAAAAARFLFMANMTHAAEGAGRSRQVRDFRAASRTGCWLSAPKP